MGILGLFVLNYRSISSHFKEQIVMNVYLKNSAKEIEITQLKKKILLNPATKKVNYISKEQAAESYVSDKHGSTFFWITNSLTALASSSFATCDPCNLF